MPKLFIYYGHVKPEKLFIIFNVFDILLYIVGMVKACVIIYSAQHGESLIPGLDPHISMLFGIGSLVGLLVMSYWSWIQINRFREHGNLLHRSQQQFFIIKMFLCVNLVIIPLCLLQYLTSSLVYSLICIFINCMQVTWAWQLYNHIKVTLDLEDMKAMNSGSVSEETLIEPSN